MPPHQVQIRTGQSNVSNQIGFPDFRGKCVKAFALRWGENAPRHSSTPSADFPWRHLPVVLGGQTIAPGGFNAFVLTPHVRPSQSKEQVEIVKGSERQVNRRGLS